MSSRPDDESQEVYFNGENEDKTPMTCATQTLDLLALHLPPDKLVPYLAREFHFNCNLNLKMKKMLSNYFFFFS